MNKDKEIQIAKIKGKTAITTTTIGCIGVIVAAIIGIFSINVNIENNKLKENNENLESEKIELVAQTSQSEGEYNNLKNMYSDLKKENDDLKNRVNVLESELSQYNLLVDENNSLKEEMSGLKEQIQILSNENIDNNSNGEEVSSNKSGKKVSIFDLDTFRGEMIWYGLSNRFDENFFVDTYENIHLDAHAGRHYPSNSESSKDTPIYLLNKKYTTCKGQMVWSKKNKNQDGSVWLEFYSSSGLIASTNPITATDRISTFEIPIKDEETLKIVFKTTVSGGTYIIYPNFDLFE